MLCFVFASIFGAVDYLYGPIRNNRNHFYPILVNNLFPVREHLASFIGLLGDLALLVVNF